STPLPRPDHLPIEQFGFTPPRAVTAPPAPALAPPPPAAPPRPVPVAELPAFDDMTGLPIRISGPDTPAREAPPLPPPPAPAFASQAAAPAARSASDDELLAAFLRGLGGTHQPPEMLTPGLMERIGAMLRSATEGTLQLLLTRQEFKREVRAEVTMIAAQANNPLKFSPTVEVALAHLLGPGVRGFMPAEAAMRDAFDDLRAHQFGVMVGMRAALAHVIARFEPDELEKKISSKSALDALFSANRKAKLWDQFVALYGGIATEAEDDFHNLFGKAFLEAYEAQMARLKSDA
ncbi:type VI secretion system-associated FHA domain protein TagH, partial [Variovorax paradoxus]